MLARLLLLFPLAVFSQASRAEEPANRVHVLIVADTNTANLKSGAIANQRMMEQFCAEQMEGTGEEAKALHRTATLSIAALRKAMEMELSTRDEIVVVYIACHGTKDTDGRHFFQFKEGTVSRSAVLGAMTSKRARQVILISSACSPAPEAGLSVAPSRSQSNSFGRLLLYRSRGTLGSSDVGEFGFYGNHGGLFTNGFMESAVNSSDRSSWQTLFDGAANAVRDQFRKAANHGTCAPRGG